MGTLNINFKEQFLGYKSTDLLWTENTIRGLKQFIFSNNPDIQFNRPINRQLRLGQLAEQFVFNEFEQLNDCEILTENIQIQKDKQTLGELDTIIKYQDEIYHIEIVYKFYLFDDSLGHSEIEKWIGPNRNDSFIEKVDKIKNKQLPLLYSPNCQPVLKDFNINVNTIKQRVLFKAQLFTPYKIFVQCKALNSDCIKGFYIKVSQLEAFRNCKFYIPSKLDWFVEPNHEVKWLTYTYLIKQAMPLLNIQKSPLIWIRTDENSIQKCFLVWW